MQIVYENEVLNRWQSCMHYIPIFIHFFQGVKVSLTPYLVRLYFSFALCTHQTLMGEGAEGHGGTTLPGER